MESNNSGKSDCQLDLLGAHELRESNLDVWSSDVSSVFIPRLVCCEIEEVLAGETPETLKGCGGSARNSRSLTMHQLDLVEFLTADKQIQAEISQFACSQWFSSRPVLCWPEDPMSRLLASPVEVDWAESGRLLFDRQLFVQAMLCFDKAGLPLERDVAAAYQARKEAWCLFAKSADEQIWSGLFVRAAGNFIYCAIRTDGKQQTDRYLRAAECYLQAKSWVLAATAFVSAEEYGLAAKCFCRAGRFDDAVTIVKKHKHEIQEKLVDEVLEMARLECLRQPRRSKEPFDDAGRQLAHMEDHTRLIGPECSDNMVEEVEFRDYDLLEQIRLLSASSENRMRQALTQTLRGLWISLPFGSTRSRFDNPTVLALLEQLQRFDTKLMNDDERRQVALFQAIHAQDTDKLLLMAEENVVASRLCEALLCFSHCASDLIPSQDTTISTFLSKSSLALNYYDKLATLAQDIRPSSVDIQRLLGFEPAQPDTNAGSDSIEGDSSVTSKFRLFSTSPMFERAKSMIGTLEEIPCALELTAVTISESDIDILATCTISAVLRCEVQAMHAVASVARCTEPCLGSAVFGVCRLEKCGRLDVDCYQIPNNTRQTQFHEVLRAHLLQILIIDSSESTLEERRTWIQKLYEILTPCFAPLGNAACVEHMRIPELDRGLKVVSAWCDRNLDELRPGFYELSKWFVSNVLVSLELAHRANRHDFVAYASGLQCTLLTDDDPELRVKIPSSPDSDDSIIKHFIDFYIGESNDALERAILSIHHIIFKPLMIEANVLVNLFESIAREVIFQERRSRLGRSAVFDGLLLPQSWALDIVRHSPQVDQQGWSPSHFLNALCQALKDMHSYEPGTRGKPGTSTLYRFHGFLSLLPRSILILRICRILILVAINLQLRSADQARMCTEIVRALHGPGAIHQILCERFAQASSWNELPDAFLRSAVNRGADQLVCTVHQPSATSDDYRGYVKQIIYDKIEPDLENLLALTDQCEVDANDLANQPEQNAETKESDSTSNGKTSSHASAGECRRRRKEDEA